MVRLAAIATVLFAMVAAAAAGQLPASHDGCGLLKSAQVSAIIGAPIFDTRHRLAIDSRWNQAPAWAGCNWTVGDPKGRIEALLMNGARFPATADATAFLHKHTTQLTRGWHAYSGVGAEAVFAPDTARKSVVLAVADGR
jgi:hypothetical protein